MSAESTAATQAGGDRQRLLDALDRLDIAIDGVRKAFGAPGDHGYGTAEGASLFQLYQARALLDHVRQLTQTRAI